MTWTNYDLVMNGIQLSSVMTDCKSWIVTENKQVGRM